MSHRRRSFPQYVLSVVGWLGLIPLVAVGQPKAPASGDEAAVRQAGREYVAALARGDAKAIAGFWTEEGTYISADGHSVKARELIDKLSTSGPQEGRTAPKVEKAAVRFLSPDVAVETGETAGVAGGGAIRYTATWVRQAGRWKLDSLREDRAAAPGPSERLAVLAPLVGIWTGEAGGSSIKATVHWNDSKTFLLRDLSVSAGGKTLASGRQYIGWDPVQQEIRSWVFHEDGSYGGGVWSLEGKSWVVMATGVSPDGKLAGAMHILKFADKDTLIWKSVEGQIDGEPTPDMEIRMTRSESN